MPPFLRRTRFLHFLFTLFMVSVEYGNREFSKLFPADVIYNVSVKLSQLIHILHSPHNSECVLSLNYKKNGLSRNQVHLMEGFCSVVITHSCNRGQNNVSLLPQGPIQPTSYTRVHSGKKISKVVCSVVCYIMEEY